ncbi:hypothetical protein ACFQZR_15000 [Paenibacillus sp. GCM10027629]|uniref:hypothetical protein n=1 Tax=Paenibacillus sp. GCM10027629 TaxID=3273414 RepID=UPI00362B0B18
MMLTDEAIEEIWNKANCSRGDEAHLRDDVFDLINDLQESTKEVKRLKGEVNAEDSESFLTIQKNEDNLNNAIRVLNEIANKGGLIMPGIDCARLESIKFVCDSNCGYEDTDWKLTKEQSGSVGE